MWVVIMDMPVLPAASIVQRAMEAAGVYWEDSNLLATLDT